MDFDPVAIGLLVVGAEFAVAFAAVFVVRWAVSFPDLPEPDSETSELRPEPPAVGGTNSVGEAGFADREAEAPGGQAQIVRPGAVEHLGHAVEDAPVRPAESTAIERPDPRRRSVRARGAPRLARP